MNLSILKSSYNFHVIHNSARNAHEATFFSVENCILKIVLQFPMSVIRKGVSQYSEARYKLFIQQREEDTN
jgi:hypothetical protein